MATRSKSLCASGENMLMHRSFWQLYGVFWSPYNTSAQSCHAANWLPGLLRMFGRWSAEQHLPPKITSFPVPLLQAQMLS